MTVPCQDRDFVEWHGGIPHAYLWGLELDWDWGEARRLVAPYVLPRYRRQPHVTVAFAGLAGKEVTEASLERDRAILRDEATGPVTVTPVGWSSFPQAPHLEVAAEWLLSAHRSLAAHYAEATLDTYVPHITLGFYADQWPIDVPVGRLSDLALPDPWVINHVTLFRYDTHDIAGPLTIMERLRLT